MINFTMIYEIKDKIYKYQVFELLIKNDKKMKKKQFLINKELFSFFLFTYMKNNKYHKNNLHSYI